MTKIKEWFWNQMFECIFILGVLIGTFCIRRSLRRMEREKIENNGSVNSLTADSTKLFCLGLFFPFPTVTSVLTFIK
jgi:hypothetical protein